MRSDTNFDGIAATFETEVYGASRGYIRLQVLWEDLVTEVPRIARGGLSILDAGGGAGHLAVRLAQLGNRVVLCDASREMLDRAEESVRQGRVSEFVTLVHTPIQELSKAVAALVSVGSLVMYAPLYLAQVPLADLTVQVIFQGIVVTIISLVLYGRAVLILGAPGGSAFGALVPALSALLAIPLLQEWPTTSGWVGIVLISAGVYLASGGPLPVAPRVKGYQEQP